MTQQTSTEIAILKKEEYGIRSQFFVVCTQCRTRSTKSTDGEESAPRFFDSQTSFRTSHSRTFVSFTSLKAICSLSVTSKVTFASLFLSRWLATNLTVRERQVHEVRRSPTNQRYRVLVQSSKNALFKFAQHRRLRRSLSRSLQVCCNGC